MISLKASLPPNLPSKSSTSCLEVQIIEKYSIIIPLFFSNFHVKRDKTDYPTDRAMQPQGLPSASVTIPSMIAK